MKEHPKIKFCKSINNLYICNLSPLRPDSAVNESIVI